MNIIDSFIKKNTKARPGIKYQKKWIVIHETGNKAQTANAKNHATYLHNIANANQTYLSWHYTVDDKEIFHHMPDEEIAWHAGDGKKLNGGNTAGIGIEICVNSGSDFEKAVDNAALLTGFILKNRNLDISAVKQHFDFSKKNCPQTIRHTNMWNNFLEKCEYYKNTLK